MPRSSTPPAQRPSAFALQRIIGIVDAYLAAPEDAARDAHPGPDLVDAVLAHVSTVEALSKPLAYRDALLVQLAFGFVLPVGFDHTRRADGGRTVAEQLGTAFAERHVPAVRDAFQNIGKNSPDLARGNVLAFDSLLRWMNEAEMQERQALFHCLAARAALTARPVLPMPELRSAALTFAAVTATVEDLLSTPSGGAFEQFAVAAFLEAVLYEFGLSGAGQLGVRTKNINASDASSGTSADVQIVRGNKIEEAFEVSANDWRSKVAQAVEAARNADLSRVHVVANVSPGDDLVSLESAAVDVSVMDVRAFLRSLIGVMRKPSREVALRRLYELIDRNQPDVDRVNLYVRLLSSRSLTAH